MNKIKIFESALIPIDEIVSNSGQIKGLPKNPRFIRTNRFEALKKSIQEDPEFLGGREILVFKHKKTFVVIGGNMRFKACQELGIEEIPCKIIPETFTPKQLRAFTIKDNVSFGEVDWESIANEWDLQEVKDFGVEIYADTDIDFFGFDDFEESTSETTTSSTSNDEDDDFEESDNSIGSNQHICPHCGETFFE